MVEPWPLIELKACSFSRSARIRQKQATYRLTWIQFLGQWRFFVKIKTVRANVTYCISRLNSEDFSKIFSVVRYFIFDLFTWKQTSRNVKNAEFFWKCFRIFLNIHDFFELFKVFRIKLLSTARHKHVICIIRCAIKFHVGLFLSGRWARLGKNGFIGKTVQKWDFTRVEIA